MNKKSRPVIALMKSKGATKGEMDLMDLYFDKYNLDETYVDIYKAMQRTTVEEKRRKLIMKYAVVYHNIAEGENFNFDLIDIGNDLEKACAAMFNHFDDNNQQSKICLMAGDDPGNHKGLVYYVVNLEDPPVAESDYQWLSRYYILSKKVQL